MQNESREVQGDVSRQALDSLGGYAYQIYATALAWIRLNPGETLFVEVAEDYATLVNDKLTGSQIKRTQGSLTLNSDDAKASINSFVSLCALNPTLTTLHRPFRPQSS